MYARMYLLMTYIMSHPITPLMADKVDDVILLLLP